MRPKPRSHPFQGHNFRPAAVRQFQQVPVFPAPLSQPVPAPLSRSALPSQLALPSRSVPVLLSQQLPFLHGKLFLTHCMCQSSTGYVPAAVHPHIRTYIISTLIPYARIPLSRAFRPEGSDPGSPGLVTAQSEVSLTQMPECGSTVSSLFRRS